MRYASGFGKGIMINELIDLKNQLEERIKSYKERMADYNRLYYTNKIDELEYVICLINIKLGMVPEDLFPVKYDENTQTMAEMMAADVMKGEK